MSTPPTSQDQQPPHPEPTEPTERTEPTAPAEPTEPLWRPDPARAAASRLVAFQRWAAEQHGAPAAPLAPVATDAEAATRYADLHRWSVEDLPRFWTAVTEYFDVRFHTPPTAVLAEPATMPGASWFPGATLNYAEHALRAAEDPANADRPAILHLDERTAEPVATSWSELRRQVGSLAAALRARGVRPGDRVSAYLPNIPQAAVALLATAAVGATWTSCAPDFGARSVLDRFQQIEPTVLFAVDGYHYGGKNHDRTEVVAELRRELPTLRTVVHVPLLDTPAPEGTLRYDDLVAGEAEPVFEPVPFDHPLWVLYSSGTTGLPKAIVQSQGGILVEHLKQAALHLDLGPDDRFLWYTSTGWMMWNFLLAGLLTGTTIVTYDGSPGHPDTGALWSVAARTRATVLGTSAAYVIASRKAELHPGRDLDLSAVRCLGTTGSPLPPDGFQWIYDEVKPDVWLASVSGGTDVCSCFVGGVPTLPVHLGEIQAPCLGAAVEAWDPAGHPLTDAVGELVVTKPLPSMPTGFWNDPDGVRYHDSYFDTYPGIWRHGDWITATGRGTVVIHGRSDSTLNRQGVRMGSADIYEVVERLPEIAESLVIGLEEPDGGYWMPLFVVLAPDAVLDDDLTARIRTSLRTELSPRHVPDEVITVQGLPHTLTGKRLEVPVKRLLGGTPLTKAVNPGSVDNLDHLRFFEQLATTRKH
ncbi:acetoacetate--CoA ligase [Kitasatospora sp. CB01950]|uniref:acetoacetate--CoA ligase n=1 Tax=Kitasatospora sp. CB01950 TaxID=1703930 RepID=UPI00093DD9AB|nr:acetoacetate--CoA ligase [Kitasatospora sp. CB01950]OKJ05317.1 acetoacetyl-CoA synthetase [Kitasatospora sp. CB01950]